MDNQDDDVGDFPMMDFQMPDLSQIGRTMRLMMWLPIIISSFLTFIIAFFGQIVYYGLVDGEHYVLKSDLMIWFFVALAAALLVAAAMRMAVGRNMKKQVSLFNMG